MKSILLVAILLFVLAGVHSISTRRHRVERQAPTEAGDGDNETDDDDNDDDDDEEDPPEESDTLQVTRGNQNTWTNQRVDTKKVNTVATNVQNKPGIDTKPAVTPARTHWSRNHNHHKTHRPTHRQAHRQTNRQAQHQAPRQTHQQAQHKAHRQTHRQAQHQAPRQTHRPTHRQTKHQTNRQAQRQAYRQNHRQANRQTHRQVHRQNHQKSHMRTKSNQHRHYQTNQQSPSASKMEKISGTFANRKTFRKQTSNVRQNSNTNLERKFRNVNSPKVNAVSNTKQTQETLNHNRHRHNNIRKTAVQGKHQNINRQRNFNWGNRGLKIRQPQQTLTPVTPKPTLAPSVTRSWDHVTRQVSPQPTYTTPAPPVHRTNPKSSVVHNRWNRNRFVNSNRNTGPSYSTSKEVKQRFAKTITNNPNSAQFAQKKATQTSAKSSRWQQSNNRFNKNQMKTNLQKGNYWNNQRQQQSTSGRFVPHQQRANDNVVSISPVSDNRATQYPVRKEFMASSVKQSRKPDKAMQTAIHSPAVLSSPNSNTAKRPSTQLSNVIHPQHVSNVQRKTYGTRNNIIKSGKNIWNGVSNTGVTWSGTSTFNSGSSASATKGTVSSSLSATVTSHSGLSADNIDVRANSWNTPTPSASALGKQIAGQVLRGKQTGSSTKLWKTQPSISSSLSTSTGWLNPPQAQMDLPKSPKIEYKTNGNGQTKEQVMTDSAVSKSSLVDSLTTSSVSPGSSKANEWSSQPKFQNRMPTIKNRIGWASESGSINQQANAQSASTVSSPSSTKTIPSNIWSPTLDTKRHHQHGQEQQQQQQQQQQMDHQHQQKQLPPSPDKYAWMPTPAVSAVQKTPNVVHSVSTPTVAFQSEPSVQLPLETVIDNRNRQQSAMSSSTKNLVPKSSSASTASYVPNNMFHKHVENKAIASSIIHDIPIPSFEAMGLTREPTDSLTATNNVALSLKSSGKISSQNVHTNSMNTIPNTLARHFIRESVTEHHTETKIEEKPKLKKEAVIEKPTTNQGSTFDHVSLYRLTTKKPLVIGSDSHSTNQRQTHVSQTVDSPKQTISHGVDNVSRVAAKTSIDIGLYAPTLTINGGETEKPSKVEPVVTITAKTSPPSPRSPKQQPQNIQGTKEVGSAKGTSSLSGNNNYNDKGTEQLRKQTVYDSSVNSMYNNGISGITRHSIDTSTRTSSTDTGASAMKSPSTLAGTPQSTTSGKHHQSNSVSSVSSLSHPKIINNNFLNFETKASIPNKISTTSTRTKTSSSYKQGQQSDTGSGRFSVNHQNKNIAPSLSQPQGKSSPGIFSISDQNKVKQSFSKNTSEKEKTIRSDVTGTKDNTALLSQQSMVLHHNIDVIQSGTSSINQGGGSLSMITGDVDKGNTNAISVTESKTRQSQKTVFESPAVIPKQQSGYRVVEPPQDIPHQLKQSILQPMSFIDSVNKEMAARSAQHSIPVVNQVRKDRVFVSRRNEWDKIVPSIPDILASMGRPKLSFGVDPGHTVQAIKRVPTNAKDNEVVPAYNTKHKESKQSSSLSALDVALGRSNHVVPGKQNKKTLEANKKSGKSENITKSDVSFIEYNTIERRQSQTDPIKEVQAMYNQLGGTLPIVGEAPFDVGLPGDQVYAPTSSGSHYQPIKESLSAGPKTLTQGSPLGGTTVSPSSSNVLYHGPLSQGETDKTTVNSRKSISKPKQNIGLYSSNTRQNQKLTSSSVMKTDTTQKGTHLVDVTPVHTDTTVVSSSALSSPVKGSTRSVGVLPSTTVATTVVPSFSTRKITTSHNVLLERLFDYATLVATTPTPVNRNGAVVYTQMQNGPFREGQKVTQPEKYVRPSPMNRNNVVDYTKVIGRPSMENNKITDSVKDKWRPSFTFNKNNVLANRGSRPKIIGIMNSITTDSKTQSLVSFSNTQGSSHFASSHNEVRKVDVPKWNADYSVANSLSGFGEIDLKLQSKTNTSMSASPAGDSGKGNNPNGAVSAVTGTADTGSSNQAATVKPIVSGKIGKSLTKEVVTGDTGSVNTSYGNILAKSYDATNEAPAASSLISPSGVNMFSADSSSISLMAHNSLEYGIEPKTKTSVEQTKSAEKPDSPGNKLNKFSILQTTAKGNIDSKTDKFHSARQNHNEMFPGRMKFQRHNGFGLYSAQADSKRKQNSNALGKIDSKVETSFTSRYFSRPPPQPMSHSRGMPSHQTAGRIRGKYNFMTG